MPVPAPALPADAPAPVLAVPAPALVPLVPVPLLPPLLTIALVRMNCPDCDPEPARGLGSALDCGPPLAPAGVKHPVTVTGRALLCPLDGVLIRLLSTDSRSTGDCQHHSKFEVSFHRILHVYVPDPSPAIGLTAHADTNSSVRAVDARSQSSAIRRFSVP